MRADWAYVSGVDELDEYSSAAPLAPTVEELEAGLEQGGQQMSFHDWLVESGLDSEAETLFGMIHSFTERQRTPLLQGLTWPRWLLLVQETTPTPPQLRPLRVPPPVPLHRTGRWTRQLTTLGTTPSAPRSGTLSRRANKKSTRNATSSS